MKKRVAILYGGPSSEHEVSKSSARNILENLDTDLFDPVEVFISKEGLFDIKGESYETEAGTRKLKEVCDVVFPALHGSFGEDGVLQALLEKENIPFVGSGSTASHNAMDKNISNELFAEKSLNIPQSQIVHKDDSIIINFPIILKPVNEGSSVGLYKCNSPDEFNVQKEQIFSSRSEMLAQEFITGREFTCGVLEIEGKAIALPVTEVILSDSGLFDYDTKYTAGKCREITPADTSLELKEKIQNIALDCHSVLGCKSLSRTDVIVQENGTIYVLETNTLPGMTKTSFIPAQAQSYGLTIKELITCLINSAI